MSQVEIYNTNCLDGIKELADESIDLIVTDPPYCVGTTSNGKQASWTDNSLIVPFFDRLFEQFFRVLKQNTSLYLHTDWRTYPLLYGVLQEYFSIQNLIVWDYEWIKAGNYYRFSHELILYATKGRPKRTFSPGERDVWRIKPINYTSKGKLYKTQKPLDLTERMIQHGSKEGDTILDAFLGSGTTACAAIKTGRNLIGYEINKRIFDVAQWRIGRAREGEFIEYMDQSEG
ncbi:DNA-methyltransferase [Harryflintia acetispora]|uniref:DNA-methyltransferase n=1 Tax=Harryflintia acetispora TaxID=1849041 RepID=UPI00189913A5|nr:site-specific DNA-methyltransferase [Harryflintia acetispora]